MVGHKAVRACGEKQVLPKIQTAQLPSMKTELKIPNSLYTCSMFDELPSNMSTMTAICKFAYFLNIFLEEKRRTIEVQIIINNNLEY